MKLKTKIIIMIILTIILGIMLYFYFKDDNKNNTSFDFSKFRNSSSTSNTSTNSTKSTQVTASSQVSSALTENLELHATYYYKEIYVSENQLVKKGTKILKYTNGSYLKAPYDLVITSINVPSKGDMVGYNHYITVSSNNNLAVSFKIDESKVSSINIGDSAKVKITALDKELTGIVTKISNTASNGKFTVTVEFDNDGTVMIGMSTIVSI